MTFFPQTTAFHLKMKGSPISGCVMLWMPRSSAIYEASRKTDDKVYKFDPKYLLPHLTV